MADTQEKIILEVDVTSLAKNVLEAKQHLETYRAEMEKAVAANGEMSEQAIEAAAKVRAQSQEVRQLEGSLVRLTQAEKLMGASLQSVIKNYDASKHSIDENRKVLNSLNAEYVKTRNPTAEFTNAIRKISDTLKQQEGAIGNTTRNVGNYKAGILDAASSLSLMGKSIGGFIDPLRNMKLGFDAAGGGVKGFSAALATTGLPLVILAINTLISAFTAFKPIADAVAAATVAIGAGFDALVSGGNVAASTREAYQLTRQLQDLEDAQNGVRIATAGYDAEISRLMVSLRNKNITYKEGQKIIEDLKNAETKRFELNKQQTLEELEKSRKLFIAKTGLNEGYLDALLERGKVEVQISDETIKRLAKDTGLTEAELRKQIDQQRKQQVELAEIAEKKAKIDDDLLKKIADLTVRRDELAGESSLLREKIKNREDDFENRFAEKGKKRLDDERKLIEDRNRALDDLAAKNAERERIFIESTTEGTERRLAIFELEFETRRNKMRDAGVSEAAITRIYEAEKTTIIQSEFDKRAELENRNAEKRAERNSYLEELRISAVKASLEQETKIYELHFEKKIADLREAGFTELEIEEIKQRDLLSIRMKYAEKSVDAAKKLEQDQIAATTAIVGSGLDVISSIGDILTAEINNKQAELKEALDRGQINQEQYAEESKKLKMEQFEQNKAIALSSAILQGINATLAAYTSGAAVPIVGAVLGPLFAGLAATFAAVQIGLIASQAPPKFAEGGDLGKVIPITGRSHSHGGVDVAIGGRTVAEVEGGEGMFIMKKSAYQNIDQLSRWNMLFGGKSWGGAPVSHAAQGGNLLLTSTNGDGGFVARETSRQANQDLVAAIQRGFMLVPAPVVSVKEINTVNKGLEKSIKVAEL